jgi:N-acetylmuramoyl-L-alanine amidase/putative cell wall-binding protein
LKGKHYLGILFGLLLFIAFPAHSFAEKWVIIDPGHGGKYSGTTGYSGNSTGFYEKHGTLAISLKLRDVLQKSGYKVFMTRNVDKEFSKVSIAEDLKSRMLVANGFINGNNDNTVFVSIHHNANPTGSYVRGYQTHFFNIDKGIDKEYPPDPMQIHYSPESKRLASVVHSSMLKGTGLVDRGIIDGDLFVTRNAQVPSILVEVGFMSNPTEEALIKTSSFQQKAANSLATGINAFFKVFEVYDYKQTKLGIFQTQTEAMNYAKARSNVYVWNKETQTKIYSNIANHYAVYSSANKLLKEFVTKDEAISYGKSTSNTYVKDKDHNLIIWSNYLKPAYDVYHSSQGKLKEFYNEKEAVDYADGFKNTYVLYDEKNWIVWSNYLPVKYQIIDDTKGVIKQLYTESHALDYASQFGNVKVYNLETKQVEWTSVKHKKLAGNDRVLTAIEVSKNIYPQGFPADKPLKAVVLATATNPADALSAGPLAAEKGNAPILLNDSSRLNAYVKNELSRLKAKEVYITGGTVAVSSTVQIELKNLGYTVTRISGSTREETNQLINKQIVNPNGIFVASSTSYPDALGAASIAAINHWAIVLTKQNEIPTVSLNYLKGKKTVILGGTSVVASSVETKIKNQNGTTLVTRLGGTDRYDTLAKVLNEYANTFSSDKIILSTGENYPDALAASPLAFNSKSPLVLLGTGLNPNLQKFLEQYAQNQDVKTVDQIGGAVNDESLKSFMRAIQ